MNMELTNSEKQLIFDYVFFHIQSPLNTNQDDYRKFNGFLFRAIKMNAIYTGIIGASTYMFLFHRDKGAFRGIVRPGLAGVGMICYSMAMFGIRIGQTLYTDESLECAKKYAKEVDDFNDHYRRIYGNK